MTNNLTPAENAVNKYEQAKEDLDSFLRDDDVREVLLEMNELVTRYNETLDKASRAVKAQLRSSDQNKLIVGSIGAQKKFKRWYDANFLANSLPAKQFDSICRSEKIVYELDTERLEQLARQGEIDLDIVRCAYHEQEQNPSALPGTPKPYTPPPLPALDE